MQHPSFPLLVGLLAGAFLAPRLAAQVPSGPVSPPHQRTESAVDSGYLDNTTDAEKVVFSQRIHYADTGWLQFRLGEVTHLPAGSFLRFTAEKDRGVQRHDGRTLGEWGNWSAAFNGDAVQLELVAAPRTRNRVRVIEVIRGLHVAAKPPESICGTTDDRVKSSDPRQGRLWLGCTGWLIGTVATSGVDLMLTAGHCTTTGTRILELNVPDSTSSGGLVRSAPNDQYPYVEVSGLNGGIGADWRVCTVGRNSTTGKLPTEANGGNWYKLGAVPTSTSGQNITITGYGTTSPANSLNQVQKIHTGPLSQINATSLCYATDTSGGNSGSPIIDATTGNAVGIHTHGGCGTTGGCNSGTRIDRQDLQAAIAAAGKVAGAFTLFGTGCRGTGKGPSNCVSVNAAGGTLSNTTAVNEYAYRLTTTTALSVTGFSIYSASTSGSVTVGTAIYLDVGGLPSTTPLAQGSMVIGSTPGFYSSSLVASIPAGTFYVSVDHSAGNTYLADITSGTSGIAFWRRPPFGTSAFAQSGLVSFPSVLVQCTGGGSNNAVPLLGSSGTPEINRSFDVTVSQGLGSANAALILGASNTAWSGGPLPFSLASLGAPGCSLLVSMNAMAGTTLDASGFGKITLSVPNDPQLIGVKAYGQFYVVDAGANALQIAVSAGGEIRVGG